MGTYIAQSVAMSLRYPNIVILAGGISSRMKERTPLSPPLEPELIHQVQDRAKSMIGVGPTMRPFLDYLLCNVSKAGYRNVVIVVGERDESVRDYYERGVGARQWMGLTLSFAVQRIPPGRSKPLGAADALFQGLMATPFWQGQKSTVCNSDNLYSVHALRLLLEDGHENAMIDYDRSALKFDHERIMQFAVTQKEADGSLLDIMEKPSADQIARAADPSGRIGVSMNTFRLSYDMILPVLEAVPLDPMRQEKDMPAAIRCLLMQHPRSVFTIPLAEHVIDLTYQADIPVVRKYLQREFPDF